MSKSKKHMFACRMADLIAEQGTCNRARVGCVFLSRAYEVLSTGYNGAPRGFEHCEFEDCVILDGHCVRSNHAEQNAITQAAKRGTALEGSIVYVTHTPCPTCIKMLVNLGVSEVHVRTHYGGADPSLLPPWQRSFSGGWHYDWAI